MHLFWRTVAALLLTLNAAALAYGYLNPQPGSQPREKTEPRIAGLTLLSERDDGAMAVIAAENSARASQAAQSSTQTSNRAVGERCFRLGPFLDESTAQSALDGTQSVVEQVQIKQSSIRETRGYWVYLAAESSREIALKTARQLSAANIRDYYVVTAGENENAISLGMFKDALNADKRISQIAGLGFFPKRAERFDEKTRYFIEFSPSNSAATPAEFDASWVRTLDLPREVSVANFLCKI